MPSVDDILVDDEDEHLLESHVWGFTSDGYVGRTKTITIEGVRSFKKLLLHRVVMDAPDGVQVDHINRNKLDNRKSNLRLCSNQQNQMNKPAFGCFWNNQCQKWQAEIKHKGKRHYLGLFVTAEEAQAAYDAKSEELRGEYAYRSED